MTLLERYDNGGVVYGLITVDEIRRALAIAERVEARANDKRLLTSRVVAQQIIKEADELLKEGK